MNLQVGSTVRLKHSLVSMTVLGIVSEYHVTVGWFDANCNLQKEEVNIAALVKCKVNIEGCTCQNSTN